MQDEMHLRRPPTLACNGTSLRSAGRAGVATRTRVRRTAP